MQMRRLAVPGYLVAFLIFLFPLLDTALSVWPPQTSQLAWRFGAAGLFSRALMTPLLAVLIAYGIALVLEHRTVLRVLAIVNGLAVVLIVLVMGLFVLDALEMRVQVRPDTKRAFDAASTVALVKYGTGMLAALAFAVHGWKASKRTDVAKKVRRSGPEILGRRPVSAPPPAERRPLTDQDGEETVTRAPLPRA
jgi:hypothetical protein